MKNQQKFVKLFDVLESRYWWEKMDVQ